MASGPAAEHTRHRDAHAEETPAAAEFRVDVAREHDAVRISPVGDLDMATIGGPRAHIGEAIESGAGRVILDLRETTFIDSTALHLILETVEAMARTATRFAIIPGPPAVQRTFEITGLSARLPFVDVPRA